MRRTSPNSLLGVDNIPMPTCIEQANETLQELAAVTRRSFLNRGLTAAAVPAAILGVASISEAAQPKNGNRNGNNNNNNNGNNGNGNGNGSNSNRGLIESGLPTYFPGQTRKLFQEIQVDEASHVNIIQDAIILLGGKPRPYPTFQGLSISDPQMFLNLSNAFENTGVHAYFGAAAYIQNPAVLAVAASIAFVEAYHSGWINSLSNQTLVPGGLTYATPFTPAQVVAAVSPYIVSLNDPTNAFPATYSTTPSPENDIAILNFALIAEYLEATFYFESVPQVFSRP